MTFSSLIVAIKHFLSQLNIPVRKLIPDEVVKDVTSHTEFELVKVFSDLTDRFIEVVENPAVCHVTCLTSSHFKATFSRATSKVNPSLFIRI